MEDKKMISEIMIVALTIAGEAAGEPLPGKVMVGEVIANRAKDRGQSKKFVCLSKNQFSCWNGARGKKLRRSLKSLEKQNSRAWQDCKAIAREICQRGYKPVSPAQYYYNPSLCSPPWARSMEIVASVGQHLFLKEKKV
jgi:spore germination cell wall hydrolase CwlJ-like protein